MKYSSKKLQILVVCILIIVLVLNNSIPAMIQTNQTRHAFQENKTNKEKTPIRPGNALIELIKNILMKTQTIGRVKQIAYKSVALKNNPDLETKVETFFNILRDLGVKNDMTLLEVDPIIDKNWELIQSSVTGINKRCDVYISAVTQVFGCSWWPLIRNIGVFGSWSINYVRSSEIRIKGTYGIQECYDCEKEGEFLLFFGTSSKDWFADSILEIDYWAWISISNVPFV